MDIQGVEEIVQSLYSPNNDPEYIKLTQGRLQNMQLSDQGWDMANILLKSEQANCQFFGALTFTVKINSLTTEEGESLDKMGLLHQLLSWLIYHKSKGSLPFVLRKILSTLAVFFIRFYSIWPLCVATVLASIHSGEPVVIIEEQYDQFLADFPHSIPKDTLQYALQYCEILIQQLGSTINKPANPVTLRDVVGRNGLVALKVMQVGLQLGKEPNPDTTLIKDALDTLSAWIGYYNAQRMDMAPIEPFGDYVLFYLNSVDDDEVYESAANIVADSYASRPFFPPEFKANLTNLLLIQGNAVNADTPQDNKLTAYATMLTAFAEQVSSSVINQSVPQEYHELFNTMLKLTALPGVPVVENIVVAQLLEFWTGFIEDLSDTLTKPSEHQKQLISTTVRLYWQKVRLPKPAEISDWTRDDWDGFMSFRRDVCDLLEAAYPLIGISLLDYLVNSVIDALGRDSWEEIEGSLFSIDGLSDAVDLSDEAVSSQIRRLFESPLLSMLPNCRRTKVRQTTVNFIGSYDSFFVGSQGQEYLPATLDFLFKSLATEKLSLTASKSIQKLCSSSRSILLPLLTNFFDIYYNMKLYSELNSTAHERTVVAMSYIVQASQDLPQKAEYVNRLVDVITAQIEAVFHDSSRPAADPSAIERVVSLLRCLAAIGKGLQEPEEVHVSALKEHHNITCKSFWDSDQLQIRPKIINVIRVLTIEKPVYNQLVDICEACCDIFKAGFCEVLGGPFVFPAETVVEFIRLKHQHGPPSNFTALGDLAARVVTSQAFFPTDEASTANNINRLLSTFFAVNSTVQEEYEPDVQVNNLKLLVQILLHHPRLLVLHSEIEHIIKFSLEMLQSTEKFVLTEASKFWVHWMDASIKGDTEIDQKRDMVTESIGQQLVYVVISAVSGAVARSLIGPHIKVLSRLVSRFTRISKPWFEAALITHPPKTLSKTDEKVRRDFMNKIFLLRGVKETPTVVKDFWMACRAPKD
ncbi:hypothetical protein TRVA0_047S00408 [Trichomonascus vanleenenianus]|uniref:Kap122p n=1 Tax=Trichomonascus vanleenenianus TaxID=2268995 RepID=UPI003EC967E7